MKQLDLDPRAYRRRDSQDESEQPVFKPGGAGRLALGIGVYVFLVVFTIASQPFFSYLYDGPYMQLVCWLFGCGA